MLGMSDQAGYALTDAPERADVIVVNTCGFIGAAKEESIDTILEMAEWKKNGSCQRLVVTGCLSQRYPEELHREIPDIDHILGSGEVEKVAAAIRGSDATVDVAPVPAYLYDHTTPRPASQAHFSRYVKIAEGCDRPCGFCIIPKLRGPQRSRSLSSIADEVAGLSHSGVVEINLVAQDLTTYGTDLPFDADLPGGPHRATLANLLRRIGTPPASASSADWLRWVRLHYAYPTAVTDELLTVMAEQPRVVKYLDCPLQHADDQVLKTMRRGHVGKTVWQLVERARKQVPGIILRTTFIVGHPGETAEAFQRLCDFVQQAEFDHVGVFTYSPEEGTHSATLTDERAVPPAEAVRRQRELLRLQRKIAKKRRKTLHGQEIEVLVEGESDESEYLLQGRHAGQAPEIDGHVYLSLGEGASELPLRPGDLVSAIVRSSADYDLAAEVTRIIQPAYRPPQSVKLRVLA
jgi:ribosomal protein S12 methylthiotransferase